MPPSTSSELLDLIQASGLLEREKIERAQQLVHGVQDAASAGNAIVAQGLLTDWQMARLMEGRSKGFFLGKYKLLSQLGAGAMGSVYLGEHKVMRHRVAIKVLAKRLIGKPGYIRRFQQEARAAAAVSHPRLVRAFDVDAVGGLHFMVMEFVSGENLRAIVQRHGPLSIEQAAEYTCQTAEGLFAAHRAGLIHRDVKPSNLILDENDQIRVLDLGLARIIDDEESSVTLANDTKLIGTVDYLAPEQARDCHHIDARADIYSLGCSLYYFLCGQPPYSEGSLTQRIIQHQTVPARDIRELRPDCPDDLAAICFKMLAKKVEERFQTAGEVATALRAFLAGNPAELAASQAISSIRSAKQPEFALAPLGEEKSKATTAARTATSARRFSTNSDELELAPDDDLLSDSRSSSSRGSDSRSSKSTSSKPPRTALPPAATNKTTFERDLHDDTDPEQPGGSETFVGFLDDWNAVLNKAADSTASNSSNESGGFNSNVLDQVPVTSGTAISGASMASARSSSTSQAENSGLQSGGLDIQAIRNRAMALVSEKDQQTGKSNPALWFCIIAGILLGLILVGVSASYLSSFQEKRIEGKESTEDG